MVAAVTIAAVTIDTVFKFEDRPALTGPTPLRGRVAVNQGIRRHVASYHRGGADHRLGPDRHAANDRGIGPDRGPAADQRGQKILVRIARKRTARRQYVGEYHRRPAKNVVFERHATVYRNVVLNFHIVSDANVGTDHHVLPDAAIASYFHIAHNVTEMPNRRPRADFDPVVDIRRFVNRHDNHNSHEK